MYFVMVVNRVLLGGSSSYYPLPVWCSWALGRRFFTLLIGCFERNPRVVLKARCCRVAQRWALFARKRSTFPVSIIRT